MSPRGQKGFTLVELAIVLVIIGLILGMAFKGRSLIEGAQVKNMAASINKFQAATNSYYERYQAYPGDGCTVVNAITVAQCQGARNGLAQNAAERSSIPTLMNALNITQDSDWKSPTGLRWGVPAYNAAWMVPNVTNISIITATNDATNPANPAVGTIDNRFACALDKLIDDGVANTGIMRANNAAAYTVADVDCWTTVVQNRGAVSIAVRMYP